MTATRLPPLMMVRPDSPGGSRSVSRNSGRMVAPLLTSPWRKIFSGIMLAFFLPARICARMGGGRSGLQEVREVIAVVLAVLAVNLKVNEAPRNEFKGERSEQNPPPSSRR